jgi:hypothetical protein
MAIYIDKPLSQMLERTEARANADFVETRARLYPESGAAWIEVAGTYAMFDGLASPLTQTFGLGLFDSISHNDLDTLEKFFADRDAPVFHEVSPLADASLLPLLNERGYQPIELTTVMFRALDRSVLEPSAVECDVSPRLIADSEGELWANVSATGWSTEGEDLSEFMFNFGQINTQCSGSFPFIAELNDEPIATGMLFVYDDVAILAGASTVLEGRKKGAQNALLRARLRFAYERGCTFAMMGALPGSQSQTNAQKNGFNIAYTRIKWQLRT